MATGVAVAGVELLTVSVVGRGRGWPEEEEEEEEVAVVVVVAVDVSSLSDTSEMSTLMSSSDSQCSPVHQTQLDVVHA